jgi:hypothetical protein
MQGNVQGHAEINANKVHLFHRSLVSHPLDTSSRSATTIMVCNKTSFFVCFEFSHLSFFPPLTSLLPQGLNHLNAI